MKKPQAPTWLPIPVAPKYEINKAGTVRNIKTGRVLKIRRYQRQGDYVCLQLEPRKAKEFSISNLLWLVHGIVRKVGKRKSNLPLPVTISHGNEVYFFETCSRAAKFLAERHFYSAKWANHCLSERRKNIFGWKIVYHR